MEFFPAPEGPKSYVSPGGTAGTLKTARDTGYVIGGPKASTIYYTLDGSMPNPNNTTTTMSGMNPVSLGVLPGGTTITYFSDSGSPYNPEKPQTFVVTTDAALGDNYGSITENVKITSLGGGTAYGPVAVVPRGSRVAVFLSFQAWTSSPTGTCPGCTLQYVAAVPSIGAIGCYDHIESAGVFPGLRYIMLISFSAPTDPGIYPILTGLTQAPGCDGSVPTAPEVAQLYVQ
jgi:hypothetical protein